MSRVSNSAKNEATFRRGANGNYYVYSLNRAAVVAVAVKIGRAPGGVSWSRLGVWELRVKDRRDKSKLLQLFGKPGGQTALEL